MARGGVAVAYPIAVELDLPLHALVVRKVGAPHNHELAIGAVSETGVRWLDEGLIRTLHVPRNYVEAEVEREVQEAQRRQEAYQTGSGLEAVRGHTAIVVDDGIATGSSAQVAVQSARQLGASEVVLATPVASMLAVAMLNSLVDKLVVLRTPEPFLAVGYHYAQFPQLDDAEVIRLLQQGRQNLEDTL
jgi:putative phosphoribosyl transferase